MRKRIGMLALMMACMIMIQPVLGAPNVQGGGQNGGQGQSGAGLIATLSGQSAHWDRVFGWTIEKTVAPESLTIYGSGSDSATFTIDVTKDAGTDEYYVTGQVCVNNSGSVATQNLKIVAQVEYKTGAGQFQPLQGATQTIIPASQLGPAEFNCYDYKVMFTPIAGANYRSAVKVTITNHSGHLGEEFGPEPKLEFSLPGSPTLVNNEINVDDTNGGTWKFSSSGSESYDEIFTCSDAGEYTNTATIRETGQTSSATVTVTCLRTCEWVGETAWAAGERYVTKGNWATYTPYGGAAKSVKLYAGQTMDAGTVSFSAPDAEDKVTVTITLNGGWRFAEVGEDVKIQDYAAPPSGNPSPGLFAHRGDAASSPFSIEVPKNNYYGVHVDVEREVCGQTA